MIPDDPGRIRVISGNFQNFMIFIKLPIVHRRRVLRTPSPYGAKHSPPGARARRPFGGSEGGPPAGVPCPFVNR